MLAPAGHALASSAYAWLGSRLHDRLFAFTSWLLSVFVPSTFQTSELGSWCTPQVFFLIYRCLHSVFSIGLEAASTAVLVSIPFICPVSKADICPVSAADICPVSTEDIAAARRRPAAVLSSVETG